LKEQYKYIKRPFVILFGHFEGNIMLIGLENAAS